MKPAPFDYHAPASTSEALALLAQHGFDAKVLAGGQSLIPTMNFRLAQPAVLVDLNCIPDLAFIRPEADGGLAIGAMTRHSAIEFDPLVAARAPLLRQIAPNISHQQIRNRGTFGGSMAHADPAAHWPTAAVALAGRMHIAGQGGERWVAADDFFAGLYTTALQPDELLTEIRVPPMPPNSGFSYRQVARQHGAFPLAGAAAVVTLDERGRCQAVRLVFLGAGDRPMLASAAARLLLGQAPTAALIGAAAETAAKSDVDPTGDIHATANYRRHLIRWLGEQVLTEALEKANNRYWVLGIGDSAMNTGRPKTQYPTPALAPERSSGASVPDTQYPISLTVNGTNYSRHVEPRMLLVDFIRHELGLTGTHVGCEHGVCGTCTILLDGQPVRSCLMFAVQAHGHDIRTVESLGTPENLHPIQQAFQEKHALQCGFCTPGFLMTLAPFLEKNPNPTEHEIREAIAGNLCRCTGYQHIVEAVKLAAERMQP